MKRADFKNVSAQQLLSFVPDYYGLLNKINKKGKSQYRFCILYGGSFFYYENNNSNKPKGYFSLLGYRVSSMVVENQIRLELSHVFSNLRRYCFIVDNEDTLKQWMTHLQIAISGFPIDHHPSNQYVDNLPILPKRNSVSSSASSNSSSSRGSGGGGADFIQDTSSGDFNPYSQITNPRPEAYGVAQPGVNDVQRPNAYDAARPNAYDSPRPNAYDSPRPNAYDVPCPNFYTLPDSHPGATHFNGAPRRERLKETIPESTDILYDVMIVPKNTNISAIESDLYVKMGSCEIDKDIRPEDYDEDPYLDLTETEDDTITRVPPPPPEWRDSQTKSELRVPPPPPPVRRNSLNKSDPSIIISSSSDCVDIGGSIPLYEPVDQQQQQQQLYGIWGDDKETETEYQRPDLVLCSTTRPVLEISDFAEPPLYGTRFDPVKELPTNLILPPSVYRDAFEKSLCAKFFETYPVGVYLIRTGREDGKDSLSVKTEADVKHYIIFNKNDTFFLQQDEPSFVTVADLIRYYYSHRLPTCKQMLTQPYR